MAYIVKIKNNSGVAKTWVGKAFAINEEYTIPENKLAKWRSDSGLLTCIADSDALVGDGSEYFNTTKGNQWLQGTYVQEMIVVEENTKTGGHFQSCGFTIDVAAEDSTKEIDISFPYPVSLLSSSWQNKSEFEGDSIEFKVGPDKITGTNTAAVSATDTEITVSQTVIDNISIGYYVKISDGTNTDDLGRVLSIDTVNSKITVETAATNAFAIGAYIKQTVKLLPKSDLDTTGPMALGESKIGGSYVPANTTMRAIYYNDSGTAKKMRFFLEYLY